MATEVVKVIDPDMGSGYDYDSLFDWEAAQQGDLTGARNEIAVAKCRCTAGTADTTAVTIDGWTASATQFIKVWTDPSEAYRHNGTYQTGNKYRMVLSVTYNAILSIRENFVRVIGLQINNTGSKSDHPYGIEVTLFASTTAFVLIDSNIVLFSGTGTPDYYASCIYIGDLSKTYIINNLLYNGGTALRAGYKSHILYVYNNTFVDFSETANCTQLEGGSFTIKFKNNLSKGCAFSASGLDGGAWTASSTNLSNGSPVFLDEGADNFHLASNDTVAIGQGTNLYNDADYPFQTDIDGQDRGGAAAAWDIGADEYVVSIELEGFRFRNDDGSESAATWKDSQDVNITLAANTSTRIRAILNATGDPASIGAQLEARYKPSVGAFGSWTKIQ